MNSITRREFLKLSSLAGVGVMTRPPFPDGGAPSSLVNKQGLARVAIRSIQIYHEPSFQANRVEQVERDELISLLDRVTADDGPRHNPLWFRIQEGYIHSGSLQLVEWKPQKPLDRIRTNQHIFEVSVPYTRSYTKPDPNSDPLYRLYYSSTAWVESVTTGADGRRWYQLLDDVLRVSYYVRAEHLRLVPKHDMQPISPEVPFQHKRIEVSLADQEVRCYEFDRLVFRTRISSGIPNKEPGPNGIPTITPSGIFHVEVKTPLRHMGDGNLTADLEAYELPGVPWVSFFTSTGVAFHGTYWHNDFGRPRSHGCVNMQTEEARWLYRWTLPVVEHGQIRRIARGTRIDVT